MTEPSATLLPTTQFLAQALLRNPSPSCLLRARALDRAKRLHPQHG